MFVFSINSVFYLTTLFLLVSDTDCTPESPGVKCPRNRQKSKKNGNIYLFLFNILKKSCIFKLLYFWYFPMLTGCMFFVYKTEQKTLCACLCDMP